MQVWYCVTAQFTDEAVRDEYLAWLGSGHMAAVVQGGALSARAVILDGPELRGATQYFFADSQAFDRYVRDFAPALRADGELGRGRQVSTLSPAGPPSEGRRSTGA